jgi:hypothetical protein
MGLSRGEKRMNRLTEEMLEQVANAVQGTCRSLEQNFDQCADFYNFGFEFEDLNVVEETLLCDYIDNRYFECAGCGWWCEVGDYAENQNNPSGDICSDCNEEEDEND